MRVLDLFSGIGGFSLGLERAGMETVAFCEIEDYPRLVLAKHWPEVPCYEDIRELSGERLRADGIAVDVICGGYPCQPFSTAGKRQGAGDDRHLWPEYLRLIQELRPSWVIGENVAGHISMGIDTVLSDLEGEGYAWEAFVIPAVAVDAPHRRDRVWIVANATGSVKPSGLNGGKQERGCTATSERAERVGGGNSVEDASDSWSYGQQQLREVGRIRRKRKPIQTDRIRQAISESPICRADDGVPCRLDRLRCLGNAVVPQIPEIIGRAILEVRNAPVED